MHPTIKEDHTPLKKYQRQIPDRVSDCAVASRRAMLETKRRMLSKLAARIHTERREILTLTLRQDRGK